MKTPKHIKKLKEETEGFMNLLASYCDKIKKEHQKLCLEQQATLIANIAKGENLNELDLREKYLNTKSKPPVKKPEEKIDEDLLDKVVLNNITYYYENKENGKIYNTKSQVVGKYSKNQFIVDSKVQSNEVSLSVTI